MNNSDYRLPFAGIMRIIMIGGRWRTALALLLLPMLAGVSAALGLGKGVQQEGVSPLALAADPKGTCLYIAEYTAHCVAVRDLADGKGNQQIEPIRRIQLPEAPSGVALGSGDLLRLYVTGDSAKGKVYIVDPARGKVMKSVAVGHSPLAPVPSPDGRLLYVCNRFSNDVSVIDLATGREAVRIPVLREPVAAALTQDGAWLFVANHLPDGPATDEVVAAAVSVIDTRTRQVKTSIRLPNGSTGLRGICLSPDSRYLYVTHTLGRYQLPTTQLDRGWMCTNAMSVIDVTSQKMVNTVLLDDEDLGAASPWGVACSADGKILCVAHAGSHEISLIERAGLHDKLERAAAGRQVSEITRKAADVPNDLTFISGLRRRIKLSGNGPRGLAVVGDKAYAAEYFSDSVAEVGLTSGSETARSLALAPPATMSETRRGEMIFNDASLCFQQWQSCASCHPDARTDGMNWDLLNDGIGNPKNVKSMLLSHVTPPEMSLGVRDKAETAVRAGIKYIEFSLRSDADASAIDTYLKAMKPTPSPYLVKGKLSRSAKKGKAVFEKAGCANCHNGPYHTSLQRCDIGTGAGKDQGKAFDTPTLKEVWRTAPYLHDGRARTIQELFTKFNPEDRHGTTRGLSETELNNLAEYVLSL